MATEIQTSIKSTFDELNEFEAAKAAKDLDAWESLVRRMANGEQIKPEVSSKIIAAAGKSKQETMAAAQLVVQRRQWQADSESGPEADVEARRLEQQIEDLQKEIYDDQQRRLREEVEPLVAQLKAAQHRRQQATEARRRLAQTYGDKTTLTSETQLRQERMGLTERQRDITKLLPDLEERYDLAGHVSDGGSGKQTYRARRIALVRAEQSRNADAIAAAKASLQQHETAWLAPLQRELEKNKARVAAIDVELAEIEEVKLTA